MAEAPGSVRSAFSLSSRTKVTWILEAWKSSGLYENSHKAQVLISFQPFIPDSTRLWSPVQNFSISSLYPSRSFLGRWYPITVPKSFRNQTGDAWAAKGALGFGTPSGFELVVNNLRMGTLSIPVVKMGQTRPILIHDSVEWQRAVRLQTWSF